MNELASKNSFIAALKQLTVAHSLTGKDYLIQRVNSINVEFVRESGSVEKVSVDELYSIYCNCTFINTTIARLYITGRMFSPAVAILIASGFYDNAGYRYTKNRTIETVAPVSVAVAPVISNSSKESDEAKFFKSLESLFAGFVISKSLNRAVSKNDVYLNDDYRLMELPTSTQNGFQSVLTQLKSDFNFGGKSLSSYIDGFVMNHPVIGSRIVEFDEEQHFSPARLITLNAFSNDSSQLYSYYNTLIRKEVVYQTFLKKHRLKLSTNKPLSFEEIIDELSQLQLSENGYIAPKIGFNYIGGRKAQRAYYDLLRDAAHLSSKNNLLKPILRFPKVLFEQKYNKCFADLKPLEIEAYTKQLLKLIYNINI